MNIENLPWKPITAKQRNGDWYIVAQFGLYVGNDGQDMPSCMPMHYHRMYGWNTWVIEYQPMCIPTHYLDTTDLAIVMPEATRGYQAAM